MLTLEDFYDTFIQGVLSSADSRGVLTPVAFLEEVSAYLIDDAELSESFEIADYRKTGIEVHGYDLDLERGVLSLIVHEFFQNKMETMGIDSLRTKFRRVKTFFEKASSGLYQSMEESDLAYAMAYDIFTHKENITRVRLIVITDGRLTNRSSIDFPDKKEKDIVFEYCIFDIENLFRIFLSRSEAKVSIDIVKLQKESIPCLVAPTCNSGYSAYLLVISGSLLYDIYDLYGQKLLEENVRTFLQFKGKVNQGLAVTIKENPEKFFAYNNGLTATAENIEWDESNDIPKIKAIHGLQIVNGGQTMSAIYACKKTKKYNIDNVSVQMKLSIVSDRQGHHDFVSAVSRCANTQNKVNESDFFANSPFHRDFKEHSERIYAPSPTGTQKKTRWFYERARGQYLTEQAYLTKSGRNAFVRDYPRGQLIEKTLLAKSENSWLMHPDIVSKGAQTNARHFAECVTQDIEKNALAITEKYFKDAVAKIIIFKNTERIISKAAWYDGGYRAQTVTYTIALLARIFKRRNKLFDFDQIWHAQTIDSSLEQILLALAERVYKSLTNPIQGIANVTQWAKQKRCWEKIQDIYTTDIESNVLQKFSANKEHVLYEKKVAVEKKKLDNSIQIQTFIVGIQLDTWVKIHEYFQENRQGISLTDMDVLSSMVAGRIRVASPNQSKCLYRLYCNAKDLGLML